MAAIPETVRAVLDASPLGHLVTLNADGSPQVSVVWVGVEDGELVAGSLGARQKLRNVERDPRVAVSFETDRSNEIGLREYLVVHGRARVTEGGAPELLQRLARGYLGPDVPFPPMADPPPGYVLRIAPERYGGLGPWA
ncbi:MAG TPA: TIGR03618 family F420-dependent PPOX class oxidoreductase [Mycobacteriales bacterium]|jgi:PPOX class probable F420-dependent enzyme|nr:TIGR03618 family F420-dependent PPOX class oxidoreductase [Mycobacteriales bacterium]